MEFARGYNGAKYKENWYGERLVEAYLKFNSQIDYSVQKNDMENIVFL